MKLFFYKPNRFNPLLIVVAKIGLKDELEKIEAMSSEIFQILMDNKDATEENILIFSIIKDYDKSTTNLILPSTKSSQTLTNRCLTDTKFMNAIVIETLRNCDTEYYLELTDSKIYMHLKHLNLMALASFYSIN